jgi:hypothetical protein
LKSLFSSIVIAAGDVPAAYGGVEIMEQRYNLNVDAIGGPVGNTDHSRNRTKENTGKEVYDFRDQKEVNRFLDQLTNKSIFKSLL